MEFTELQSEPSPLLVEDRCGTSEPTYTREQYPEETDSVAGQGNAEGRNTVDVAGGQGGGDKLDVTPRITPREYLTTLGVAGRRELLKEWNVLRVLWGEEPFCGGKITEEREDDDKHHNQPRGESCGSSRAREWYARAT